MYATGRGVEKADAEAVKWYRKAAEQGERIAQFNLGMSYANGQGVEKDDKEAVKWSRKAAERGYAGAQNNLGVMYLKGEGVEKNEEEAVKWYRKAAEQGHAIAQNNLGAMYANGTGVESDPVEALKWALIAAENGYTKFEQTWTAADMSPTQIARAYNLAKQSLGAKGRKLNLTYSYWNHVRLLIASTLGNVPERADLKEVIKAARNFNNAVDQLSVQEIDKDATDAVLACTGYFQKQIAILSTVPSGKQRIVKGAILGALFDFKGIAGEIKGELETGKKLVADWAEVKIQLRKNRVNLSRKHKRDFPPLFSN
jgi:hypothetical protein